MTASFEALTLGARIDGPKFEVTRESIRAFCDGSLDYNPLHLDEDYMKSDFGKTNFGGVIAHGMTNFGLITRMLTDWAYPLGAIHRRLETRWLKPVRPGDTIQPTDDHSAPALFAESAIQASAVPNSIGNRNSIVMCTSHLPERMIHGRSISAGRIVQAAGGFDYSLAKGSRGVNL